MEELIQRRKQMMRLPSPYVYGQPVLWGLQKAVRPRFSVMRWAKKVRMMVWL